MGFLSLSIFIIINLFSNTCLSAVNDHFESRVKAQSVDKNIIKHKPSVAAMIPKSWIIKTKIPGKYLFTYKKLKDQKNYCEGEKYRNQKSVAKCTGFLISPNKILTAAHCLDQADPMKSCRDSFWVFDYNENFFAGPSRLPNTSNIFYDKSLLTEGEQVFECKKVIFSKFKKNKMDLALIELSKKSSRPFIKITSKQEFSTKHQALGFPNGVPLKGNTGKHYYDDQIFGYSEMYAPVGSSGGPIFSSRTGKLMGLIASATYSSPFNARRGCFEERAVAGKQPIVQYVKSSSIYRVITNYIQKKR